MALQTRTIDPYRVFANAQRSFAAGDAHATLRQLNQLPQAIAAHPDVLHLRALALKGAGRIDEAKAVFEQARQAQPRNPQILNNLANVLLQTGATADALPLYDAALALQPDYRDAAYNRALSLQALGRLDEALTAIDALIITSPTEARTHSARGTILLALERHDEAAVAFDAALASGQSLPKALQGRARVALERGDADAVARHRQLLAITGNDPDVLLGLADALEADGDPAGLALLREAVASRPEWISGLERVAQMRAEAADADFTSHYEDALSATADQRLHRLSLAKMLAAADRHADALAALAPLEDADDVRVIRAYYLGEAGAPSDGLNLLAGQTGRDAALMEGRLSLATGDFDRAGAALDRAVIDTPDSIAVWAHRELLWRATGDPRTQWLSGQDQLVSVQALELSSDELSDTALLLRSLHRTRAFPIGQSLRGGTQTRGRLLLRPEPEIRRLKATLEAAVDDHLRGLPPEDLQHPLLRHRNTGLGIAGSWSVRLTSHGFHVSHIHPEGLLSSAYYFEVPLGIADEPARAGWLEIGRPPPTLNLTLDPLATIMPAPGRLALFPSFLFHGTRPFPAGERLTVAFDVVAR